MKQGLEVIRGNWGDSEKGGGGEGRRVTGEPLV